MKKDLQRALVKKFVNGNKRASRFVTEERRKRLKHMTTEDSLAEYDYLCKTYSISAKEGLGELERHRIDFLIKRRKVFNKLKGKRPG